jgi:U3 small nucleolar RNA-associated protein 22
MDDFEDLEAGNNSEGAMDVDQTPAEGDEWGGVDSEPGKVAAAHANGGHTSRVPPSGEELRTIRDATDLYRSGSFKLQVRVYLLLLLDIAHSSADRRLAA